MKLVLAFLLAGASLQAAGLRAGIARVDVTDRAAGPVHDPSQAKVLVLQRDDVTVALVTVDAVAIGGIGRIGDGFMATVRGELQRDPGIAPSNLVVNASHCHGVVRGDTDRLVIQAVREAAKNLVPVLAGAGAGSEARISENRRLRMKDGSEVDMRRAYAMPRDEDVASVGPIDPRVGVLRLDRTNGVPFAVIYHFACHPIMNPPHKGSSADFPGVASRVIEDALGGGAMAIFLQGCGGDLNPVGYKELSRPADATPLGTLLGATVLAAARRIETRLDAPLKMLQHTLALPRAADYERRIAAIEDERRKLVDALEPANINFKTFLPLLLQQKLWPEFPSHYSQSYLHDGDAITRLDADNRASVEAYLRNLSTMEKLTRLNVNLALLQKHLAETRAAGSSTLDAEVCGLRVGDFKLVTFPGELTVEVGLGIQRAAADPHVHVSGYSNGYLFYTPTAKQRNNTGYAQEDCDTLVAPEWLETFEKQALAVLRQLR